MESLLSVNPPFLTALISSTALFLYAPTATDCSAFQRPDTVVTCYILVCLLFSFVCIFGAKLSLLHFLLNTF